MQKKSSVSEKEGERGPYRDTRKTQKKRKKKKRAARIGSPEDRGDWRGWCQKKQVWDLGWRDANASAVCGKVGGKAGD